jgi:hypothetical protein
MNFVYDLAAFATPICFIAFIAISISIEGRVSFLFILSAIAIAFVVTAMHNAAMWRLIQNSFGQSIAILLLAPTAYGIAVAITNSDNHWNQLPTLQALSAHSFIATVLVLLSINAALFWVSDLASTVIPALIIESMQRRHPDTLIIETLLEILQLLSGKNSAFRDLRTKEGICSILRFTANYIENGILRNISVPDPAIRKALQDKLSGSASYLREMQIKVILSKDGTEADLSNSISSYIKMVALGFYESLPVGNLEASPRGKVQRLLGFVRILIVALIPFSCLVIARYAGLVLSSDFTGWAVVVSLAWAAITLVSAIDPLYKSRLQDVRDLMSAIRGKDA